MKKKETEAEQNVRRFERMMKRVSTLLGNESTFASRIEDKTLIIQLHFVSLYAIKLMEIDYPHMMMWSIVDAWNEKIDNGIEIWLSE